MRVLHVGIHYNPERGGGNLRNSRLIEQFLALDHQHQVALVSYFRDDNKYKNNNKRISLRYSNNSIVQIYLMLRELLRKDYDIVHFHNPRVFFISAIIPFRSKRILEFHGLEMFNGIKALLLRMCVKRADIIIVLGNYGKQLLIQHFPSVAEKIRIIPNGNTPIQIDSIPVSAVCEKTNLLISYIGTFYTWQGVYNYVYGVKNYIQQYGSKAVEFIMIGDGPEWERIKLLIHQYGLEKEIKLLGQISPSKIEYYWSTTDILLIPRPSTEATETTVPLKLMEAFAYGTLVIGSDVKGLSEHIIHGENGLLYKHDDINSLVDTLKMAIQDSDLRHKLRINAKHYSQGLPSWNDMALRLAHLYNESKAR
jgi:glycosyltransferase involved in cell wall biosynthesis